MEEFIKTDEGVFVVKHYGKDFKIEMFEEPLGSDILFVNYSSDLSTIVDENKINKWFNEYEPQIIQIMKSIVHQNIEFYKHFDIYFSLESRQIRTQIDNYITYSRSLKINLKPEILD